MKQFDVKVELQRRKSQTARILDRIKQGGATNVDLARIGTRYTERVRELRKEGHRISALYERPGLYRYVYLGQVDDESQDPEQTAAMKPAEALPLLRRMWRRNNSEREE